jgi:hypothetical protein
MRIVRGAPAEVQEAGRRVDATGSDETGVTRDE